MKLQTLQLWETTSLWQMRNGFRAAMCVSALTEYEIATTTANTSDASTTENAWILLEGRKARSKEFVLENKKKKFLRWVFLKSKSKRQNSWIHSYTAKQKNS